MRQGDGATVPLRNLNSGTVDPSPCPILFGTMKIGIDLVDGRPVHAGHLQKFFP